MGTLSSTGTLSLWLVESGGLCSGLGQGGFNRWITSNTDMACLDQRWSNAKGHIDLVLGEIAEIGLESGYNIANWATSHNETRSSIINGYLAKMVTIAVASRVTKTHQGLQKIKQIWCNRRLMLSSHELSGLATCFYHIYGPERTFFTQSILSPQLPCPF